MYWVACSADLKAESMVVYLVDYLADHLADCLADYSVESMAAEKADARAGYLVDK